MSTFHKLSFKDYIQETANAVSLVFDIPENLKINFQASRFKIFVIADSLQQKTLELLKKMPMKRAVLFIVEPSF